MQELVVSRRTDLLLTVGGPMLVGAAMGLPAGLSAICRGALTVTSILVGLVLLMVPALYIVAAVVGTAPSAHKVLTGAGHALKLTGTALLGFALPLAFLSATATADVSFVLLGPTAILVAVLLGLRGLYHMLFESRRQRHALPLFLLWSLVSLGIGLELLITTFLRDLMV